VHHRSGPLEKPTGVIRGTIAKRWRARRMIGLPPLGRPGCAGRRGPAAPDGGIHPRWRQESEPILPADARYKAAWPSRIAYGGHGDQNGCRTLVAVLRGGRSVHFRMIQLRTGLSHSWGPVWLKKNEEKERWASTGARNQRDIRGAQSSAGTPRSAAMERNRDGSTRWQAEKNGQVCG